MARKKAQTYHVSQIDDWQGPPMPEEPNFRSQNDPVADRRRILGDTSLVGLAQGVDKAIEQTPGYRIAATGLRAMNAGSAGLGAYGDAMLEAPADPQRGVGYAAGQGLRAMMAAPTTPLDEHAAPSKTWRNAGIELGALGEYAMDASSDPINIAQPEKMLAALPMAMMGGLKAVKGAKAAKVAEEALSAARVLSGAEKGAARGAKESLEYMRSHRPQGAGAAPLHDLTGTGTIYPDDVYSKNAVQYYGTGNPALDRRSMSIAHSYKNKPDAEVTIFRAVPSNAGDTINPGDWVTINGDYAKLHGESALGGDYKIVSKQVKARDIFTNGDSIHEWGYAPDSSAASPSADPFAISAPAEAPVAQFDKAPAVRVVGESKVVPDLPYTYTPEGLLVSTRVPYGPNAEKGNQVMLTGLDEVLRDPELTGRMAEAVRRDPLITAEQAGRAPASVLNSYVDSGKENLQFIMEQMKPYAERSSLWYDGANTMAGTLAKTNAMAPEQGAGVIAVLSPQKPWDQNVEVARRLVTHVRQLERADAPFAKEIYEQYVRTSLLTQQRSLAEAVKKGKLTKGQADLMLQAAEFKLRAKGDTTIGRHWSDLDDSGRTAFIRAYDEVSNPSQFPILTPEGDVALKVATNKDGKPSKLVWNSYNELGKALSIMQDGSPENISRMLGWEHKVRSFFNNISVPNYGRRPGERGPSTIDTHQVAGSHMRPMGASSPEVELSMGSKASSREGGISGSNPLYQEMLTRATAGTEWLPRQGQSISWEGLKGLFSPEQKRNVALDSMIEGLWRDYRAGRTTKKAVLDAILNEAKGVNPPRWAQ